MQDHKGFIWLGTQEGLIRYDGYNFVSYTHDPLDSTSLSENRVLCVVEDKAGTIWAGTGNGGLNRFDRTTNTFTSFHANPADPTSIISNRIYYILEDKQGMLWIATDNGLNKFDPTTKRFTCYKTVENPTNDKAGNSSADNIRAIVEDPDSTILWLGTGKGLKKFNKATGTCVATYQHEPKKSTSLSHNTILSLCQDTKGNLWVGTSYGLNRFNRATGAFVVFQNNEKDPYSLSDNSVWALRCDHTGTLWVATQRGLNTINEQTGRFSRYLNDVAFEESLSHDYTQSVFEDRSGIIWVGTYGGGINKYDPSRNKFLHYKQHPTNKNSITNNSLWALHEDSAGLVWIGSFAGLTSFDRTTNTFKRYHNDTTRYGYASDNFNSFCEDSKGNFWIGTYGAGLAKYNRKAGTFKMFQHNSEYPCSLSDNRINSIFSDKRGQLWLATTNGLDQFDVKTGKCEIYNNEPNNPASLSHSLVKTMFEDSKGRFWVGTAGGLNLFDRATGKCVRYVHDFHKPASISHSNIRTLYEDKSGTLWITTSGGLNKFNEDGTFTRFTKKDGLPSDLISGIMEDEHGGLWIGTENGLSKFNPITKTFRNYDMGDGLQGKEFRPNAFCKSRVTPFVGEMFFGGNNGFNRFHPDSIHDNTYITPVVLTAFKKFNKPVLLPTDISESATVNLSYTDYVFSLDFAALSYTNAEKNQYAYKLEGFDKDWIVSGTQRSAVYTNLDGGEYTFRVKAANSDGVWNEAGASVKLIIKPPFWETWWFRFVAVCVIVLGTIGVYRWRVRVIEAQKHRLENLVIERTSELQTQTEELAVSNYEIQRQNKILDEQAQDIEIKNVELQESNLRLELMNQELAELNHDKNEMLGIVAHDLKNPLSNIKALAKILDEEAPTIAAGDIKEFAGDIRSASERMFTLITNLLDINQIERGGIQLHPLRFDISALTEAMLHNYAQHAEAKNIKLHFQTETDIDTQSLQPGIMAFADETSTLQVLENLISNAVKYSPHGKNIYVRVKALGLHARFEVQDEGPGLSAEDKEQLFGKFARLSAQPTGGEHSTGLGLSIVKKLVEAMNGRVWCESKLGHGATFIVDLPSQEAYNS